MNRDLSLLIDSKKNVVFCIGQASIANSSDETLAMHKLLALLGNKGIRTTILTTYDLGIFETVKKKLLDARNKDALVVTTIAPLVAFCAKHGLRVFCISSDDSTNGASAVFPDIGSLYTAFNWALHTYRAAVSNVSLHPVRAVIAAAGKGARLGFDKPKVLYPLADTTPLKIFYHKLKSLTDKIIVMASPEGASFIQEYAAREHLDMHTGVVHNSIGTADTILHSEPFCSEAEDILVVWGDQVGIPRQAIRELVATHQTSAADLSFPTRLRKNPVIHLERDEHGTVQRVLRKRFHDRMPVYGENEAGIFVVKRALLYHTLREMKKSYLEGQEQQISPVEKKGEFDFLDIIQHLSVKEHRVITPSCNIDEKILGFNTIEEAAVLAVRIQEGADE